MGTNDNALMRKFESQSDRENMNLSSKNDIKHLRSDISKLVEENVTEIRAEIQDTKKADSMRDRSIERNQPTMSIAGMNLKYVISKLLTEEVKRPTARKPDIKWSAGGFWNFMRRVVKMLAVVVVVFAVLWLPYRGLVVYNSFITLFGGEPYMDLWFLMFAKTCVYINSAINPILYNAMSMKFRRAFHSLLRCSDAKNNQQGRVMRVSTVLTHSTTTRSSKIETSPVPTAALTDTTTF